MGNSNSKYDPALSNLPPGYIPTYPAIPPWKIKRRWNPFRSKKKRDQEMRQWYYTTPFVFQYPPGSQYPLPNPAVQQGVAYPEGYPGQPGIMPAAQMPIPYPAVPGVIPDSMPRRRRRSPTPDSESDSASIDGDDRRYRRQYRSASYGGTRRNPLPPPPKDVLATTPYRHLLRQLPGVQGRSRPRYDYAYDGYYDRERDRDRDYRRRRRRDHDYRERDYRDRDRGPRREAGDYEHDYDRAERHRERTERERENAEREQERRERERERMERSYDRQEREADREEREEEREERVAAQTGSFRPLRRQQNLSFTGHIANGLAGILGRGPRMPEPEPAIPRGPTPAPPGGFGGGMGTPMHVFAPVIPSSTAGPPPVPPTLVTPVMPNLGMPNPVIPPVIPPYAGGMGMPTPGAGGPMGMPTPGAGVMSMPTPGGGGGGGGGMYMPTPGGMPMPTPGGRGAGMPIPGPTIPTGAPVIPGQNVAMPGGYAASPSRPLTGMPYPMPVPFAGGSGGPPSGTPITISGYAYPELMAQSADTVLYDDDLYPTALHLFEALKFLPHRPDVAETIREAQNHEITEVSERHAQAVRPDWDNIALQMMDEALYNKFRQHGTARDALLNTGNAPLILQDAGDSFWGSGPDDLGENHMGHSLERVRQRLRDALAH